MHHGALFVTNKNPATNEYEPSPSESISLDGATITKAIDPLDGSVRIVISYKTDDTMNRERLILETKPEEIDQTISLLEVHINLASKIKHKWVTRYDVIVMFCLHS
jgi:hypothetical protein